MSTNVTNGLVGKMQLKKSSPLTTSHCLISPYYLKVLLSLTILTRLIASLQENTMP